MLSGCGLRDTSQLITPRETSHNVLALFIGACIAGRKTDCLEQRCREYRLAANVDSHMTTPQINGQIAPGS